jgi:hypothetical protein
MEREFETSSHRFSPFPEYPFGKLILHDMVARDSFVAFLRLSAQYPQLCSIAKLH